MKCPNDGALLYRRKDMPRPIWQCPLCPFNLPGNEKILTEMYVWCSVDTEGREGMMAVLMGTAQMLLANSDRDMALDLKPIALRGISEMPGWHTRLVRFSKREIVEDCREFN